ncbi:unnamed protein product [Parnassius apollo]|uniref:(apollo) hypothetical protein n=1 Tax=Parnassius apollo TaxID=110799 RepID=A0A8S3XY97_PARAO|nr:unnamed protein product [Parnassius apollo]
MSKYKKVLRQRRANAAKKCEIRLRKGSTEDLTEDENFEVINEDIQEFSFGMSIRDKINNDQKPVCETSTK